MLQTPRFPSPPPPPACPGRDPPVGLAHLNLDLPWGTEAASPERAFSRAQATVEWGERARRELQQVSLAQTSVPCPGTAVICAPHRTLLSSSPPSRPALTVPAHFGAQRRLWGGAWRDVHAPQAVAPTPARFWLRWTGTWTCKKEAGGACGARGVGIHPPHPPPPPPSAPSPALPRREPRPLGRNQRASRFQEPD